MAGITSHLILGFNATLTEPIESSGRRGGDQIKEMELKLHPDLNAPLTTHCNDPQTTIVGLSGSDRSVLDDNFGVFNMSTRKKRFLAVQQEQGNVVQWPAYVLQFLEVWDAAIAASEAEEKAKNAASCTVDAAQAAQESDGDFMDLDIVDSDHEEEEDMDAAHGALGL